MLQLKKITKDYIAGTNTVKALKGIDLEFRKNEFVSVLGPSGCGKTTMLNIIGGLDKYTDGDLLINGVSTKQFGDRDWDTYRNHSVGFVFQSYNLIPHQTVLGNVELALTLSGVAKKEKRERAVKALQRVGLGEQINKLPNQLSGGQMQRVAIARALVNDPEIILADEPTGALDSETSVQVMNLLKEISSDKLVIMVTHNPELAEKYSTRIIRLLDGEVTEDSCPYIAKKEELNGKKPDKKSGMSIFTAFSLSLKNLFTKKARTFLTAFAGSIGIIGIALILSLSSGFQNYIYGVQQDTLSNYPLTINTTNVDMSSFLESASPDTGKLEYPESNVIESNNLLGGMFSSIENGVTSNDLKSFKEYLDANLDETKVSAVKYTYDFDYHIYDDNGNKLNPYEMPPLLKTMMGSNTMYETMMKNVKTWSELIDNQTLIQSQYDLLAGKWAAEANELIVVVDKYNSIPDYNLYQMGFKSENELILSVLEMVARNQNPDLTEEEIRNKALEMMKAYGIEYKQSSDEFTFDDVLNKKYKILLESDYFIEKINDDGIKYYEYNENASETVINSGYELKIVGIVRLKENVKTGAITSPIAYTSKLTDYIIDATASSSPVVYQRDNQDIDATTGYVFKDGRTIESVYSEMGVADKTVPYSISIYPTSFENKDYVIDLINKYNEGKIADEQISYTDYIGVMMASITVIINAITTVLIAFVSISLVVSSIMIGIITYISVLERTKEIGVLRAMGASKRDVSRVFNAETVLVGLFAGLIGIGVTVLFNVAIINPIIAAFTGINNVATLPWIGGLSLTLISVALTLIAGLIPSGFAARKDPVVALRSE